VYTAASPLADMQARVSATPEDPSNIVDNEPMDVDVDEMALVDEASGEKVEVLFFNDFPDDFDDDDLD